MTLLNVRFEAFIVLLTIFSLSSFSYPRAILENLPSLSGCDDLVVTHTQGKEHNRSLINLRNGKFDEVEVVGGGCGKNEKYEFESEVVENHAKRGSVRERKRKAAGGTPSSNKDDGAVDDMLKLNESEYIILLVHFI